MGPALAAKTSSRCLPPPPPLKKNTRTKQTEQSTTLCIGTKGSIANSQRSACDTFFIDRCAAGAPCGVALQTNGLFQCTRPRVASQVYTAAPEPFVSRSSAGQAALSLMSVAYLLFGVESRFPGVSNSATTPSEITMMRSESATVLRLREHRQDGGPRTDAAVSFIGMEL
jgi:hypothetical protein